MWTHVTATLTIVPERPCCVVLSLCSCVFPETQSNAASLDVRCDLKLHEINHVLLQNKNIQCIKSSAAKFKSTFAGWCWSRDRRVSSALRIITNHTRSCWVYECYDQSETIRWVRWVQGVRSMTEFPGASETTMCRRYHFTVQTASEMIYESFWDRSLDNDMIMFFDNVR